MTNFKEELKVMISLFKAHKELVTFIKNDIKETNLDLNEFATLEVVYYYHEISVQEIYDKVLVAPSSLSYILDKLEAKDLVKRTKSPTDKRSFIISLTENGKIASEKIFLKHYQHLSLILDVLNEEEKNELLYLLKKIGYHTKEINDV